MSDPEDEKGRRKWSLPAKLVTLFAIGAVLSFGLCGVAVLNGMGGDSWWNRTADLGAKSFYVCLTGLIVSGVWMAGSRRK